MLQTLSQAWLVPSLKLMQHLACRSTVMPAAVCRSASIDEDVSFLLVVITCPWLLQCIGGPVVLCKGVCSSEVL